ncbi:MAG: hypothetical protein M0R22_13625 [Dehalococcoidia bacterium]|jgi:hypothetical protein|nr:hypothetical protein [Dehalococcoidia bacterium]
MEYPRFVFISPGANKCNGGTYDHELVKDAAEHKAAISAGFSDTVTEALEAMAAVKESIESDPVAAKRGRPAKAKE